MKLSEQWLREWADPGTDTEGLAERLTMAGLEVDGVERCAPDLDAVVVGKVLDRQPHPNADRLSVCRVDAGDAEPLNIVCGADNVYAGGHFPVAKIGAVLAGDLKIKRSKLRGEVSEGMLCSATELGIAEQADGLLELDGSNPPGTPIATALGLDDHVIELDLTPNRADCFSVAGVARDVAAMSALPFREPDVVAVEAVTDERPDIELEAGAACPAFAARIVSGLDSSARTPLWMRERLRRGGIRPLHPIVDVTNYVMLELGQPMHAYDLRAVNGTVSARFARAGESLQTLDDQTVELDEDVLVIADEARVLGVAGIMGGAASAVTADTTAVLLESAFFAPTAIAGRARRFGLHTDASLRFERGVDFAHQVRAIERATALLLEIAGGKPGPVIERRLEADLPERSAVTLRRSRLEKVLGIEIPGSDVTAMLERLGFEVAASGDEWEVTPGPWRFDIAEEADLIEEVVRLYGYDNVAPAPESARLGPVAATESRVPVARI